MIIGIDFDNTIVCYSEAIKSLAGNILELNPNEKDPKKYVKEYLINKGKTHEWTKFQGELYGPGMEFARPYRGAVSFIKSMVKRGHLLYVVSHRSKKPYSGKEYDMHEYAKKWTNKYLHGTGLKCVGENINMYFMESKLEKLRMIGKIGCNIFVDDLAEILLSRNMPATTTKILFNSEEKNISNRKEIDHVVSSWEQIEEVVKKYI